MNLHSKQAFLEELNIDPTELKNIIKTWRELLGTADEMMFRCNKALSLLRQADQALQGKKPKTRRKKSGPQLSKAQQKASTIALSGWSSSVAKISDDAISAVHQAIDKVEEAENKFQETQKTVTPLPSRSDTEIAAYMIYNKLRDKNMKPIYFTGAMVMHCLGYKEFEKPPQKNLGYNDRCVDNFHSKVGAIKRKIRQIQKE